MTEKHELIELMKKGNADIEDYEFLTQFNIYLLKKLKEERDAAYEFLYANQFVFDEETKEWREN